MNRDTKMNFVKLWANSAFIAGSSSFASVSVLSAFFLRGGMTEQQVGFYLSFTQIVNLVISLFFSGITSGCKDSRKIAAGLHGACGVATALFALFCVWTVEGVVFYPMMLLVGGLLALATAIRIIFEYKLPCEVIDLKYYSTYVAFQGLFTGIVGMAIGMVLPLLFQRYDFMLVTGGAFIASALCLVLSAFCVASLKPVQPSQETEPEPEEKKEKQKLEVHPVRDFIRLMKNRDFRVLLFPNLIRGFGAGAISMVTVIAMRGLSMSDENVSMITSATYLGTLLSCFVYAFLVKKVGIPWTGLIGSLVFGLLCFSMTGGTLQFLILYCIAYIGYNVVCNAIPDMIYHSVSQDIISSFHTWRLALTTLGTAISTALFGMLLDVVPPYVLFILGVGGIFVCTLGHFLYYRKKLAPERQ